MKYSVVIPTYNHLEDCLRPCLDSVIARSKMDETEIVISANGCTDDTKGYLDSLEVPISIVWSDEPLGYTKATNAGIEAAKGEYIALLNNDCVILDWGNPGDWLNILARPFSDDKVAVSGPSKLYFSPNQRTTGARNGQTDGDWFTIFFCAMVRKSVFDHIGRLDETFSPGYGEDLDFCLRAKKLGYRCVQVPEEQDEWTYGCGFPIYHKAEGTFHDKDHVATTDALFNRNIGIIAERYLSGFYRRF